jgi:hypothetical protein
MPLDFLTAAKVGRYLTRLIGRSPVTSQIPSTALHMTYVDADRMVQRLKEAGFTEAHVCTVKGLPATPADILDSESAPAIPQGSTSANQ